MSLVLLITYASLFVASIFLVKSYYQFGEDIFFLKFKPLNTKRGRTLSILSIFLCIPVLALLILFISRLTLELVDFINKGNNETADRVMEKQAEEIKGLKIKMLENLGTINNLKQTIEDMQIGHRLLLQENEELSTLLKEKKQPITVVNDRLIKLRKKDA